MSTSSTNKRNVGKSPVVAVLALILIAIGATSAAAVSQSKPLTTPYGTLTSDVWRTNSDGYTSGNTRQWDFQVTAKVGGTQTVSQIKTTWRGTASLRTSASISVTAGTNSVSASSSSTWQTISNTKYWSNTNGARTSSYRSNIVVAPSKDYRSGTIALQNTSYVKFSGDSRSWSISAAV